MFEILDEKIPTCPKKKLKLQKKKKKLKSKTKDEMEDGGWRVEVGMKVTSFSRTDDACKDEDGQNNRMCSEYYCCDDG